MTITANSGQEKALMVMLGANVRSWRGEKQDFGRHLLNVSRAWQLWQCSYMWPRKYEPNKLRWKTFTDSSPCPTFPLSSLPLYVTKCFITWQIVENPQWLSLTLPPSTSPCILSLAPLLPLPSSNSPPALCPAAGPRAPLLPPLLLFLRAVCRWAKAGPYGGRKSRRICAENVLFILADHSSPPPPSQTPPSRGGFLPQMSSPEQKAR